MNKLQLTFLSLISFLLGIILLFSFINYPKPPSLAEEGNQCVYGNFEISCIGNHSFGKICDNKCLKVVYFNHCINEKTKNKTLCGTIQYYKGELELIIQG